MMMVGGVLPSEGNQEANKKYCNADLPEKVAPMDEEKFSRHARMRFILTEYVSVDDSARVCSWDWGDSGCSDGTSEEQ